MEEQCWHKNKHTNWSLIYFGCNDVGLFLKFLAYFLTSVMCCDCLQQQHSPALLCWAHPGHRACTQGCSDDGAFTLHRDISSALAACPMAQACCSCGPMGSWHFWYDLWLHGEEPGWRFAGKVCDPLLKQSVPNRPHGKKGPILE